MRYTFTTTTEDNIYQHPMIWCNGRFFNINSFGLPIACHPVYYATDMFGGTGVRLCTDGRHRIFRAQDHVQRILDHTKGFGLKTSFTKEQLLDTMVQLCQYNLPHLNANQPQDAPKTDDLYLRMSSFPADLQLGVDSPDKADFLAFSQDLTQYLKIAPGHVGASLLYPGPQLFRRADPTMGLPFFKSASNYAAGNLWKRIAKHYGAVESLANDPSGEYISETTGACIFFIMEDGSIITPSLNSMCLDSITRRTIIRIGHQLNHPVAHHLSVFNDTLQKAHCVFLVGTWAGPVFIEELLSDPNFPAVPNNILTEYNGRNLYYWITDNLHPKSHRYPISSPAYDLFRKIEKIYWDIVRCNFKELPSGLIIPESWHTLIPNPPNSPTVRIHSDDYP